MIWRRVKFQRKLPKSRMWLLFKLNSNLIVPFVITILKVERDQEIKRRGSKVLNGLLTLQ